MTTIKICSDRIYIEDYIPNYKLDLFVKLYIHKLNKYKKKYKLKSIKWDSVNNSINMIGEINHINNVYEIIIKKITYLVAKSDIK
jgi:hypothetical protein